MLEELKRQFSAAHRAEDTNRMKRFATTLQLFQEGYQKLIDMFVEECLPPVSQVMAACTQALPVPFPPFTPPPFTPPPSPPVSSPPLHTPEGHHLLVRQ